MQIIRGAKDAAKARREDARAHARGDDAARRPLRDHRALVTNEDDRLRSAETPMEPGANFRSVEGIIRWPDGAPRRLAPPLALPLLAGLLGNQPAPSSCRAGSTCVGHTHAHDKNGAPGMCGGTANRRVLGKRSNDKESRVDHADRAGWRGAAMPGGKLPATHLGLRMHLARRRDYCKALARPSFFLYKILYVVCRPIISNVEPRCVFVRNVTSYAAPVGYLSCACSGWVRLVRPRVRVAPQAATRVPSS